MDMLSARALSMVPTDIEEKEGEKRPDARTQSYFYKSKMAEAKNFTEH